MKVDRRALGMLFLALVSAGGGWLERRPPSWLREDPLLNPFGLPAPEDPVARLDSILHPPAPPRRPARVIDPNRAGREDWIALPGIGPKTAERILALRATGRRFRRAEDLEQVRGIGPAKVERLREWLRFPDAEGDSSSLRGTDR